MLPERQQFFRKEVKKVAEETKEEKVAEEKEAPKPEKKKGGMGKKIILGIVGIIVLFVIIGAVGGGGKKETPPTAPAGEQREEARPEEEQPIEEALSVSTAEFITEFDENQLAAEEKYKDKLIEFTAVIGNISEDILGTPFLSLKPTAEEFYMGTTIKCSFKEKSELTAVKNGQTVTLQGVVDTQSLGIISIKSCKIVSP